MGTKEISGTIFNVQKFSIHDGPGIRTLVFLKGCPLRCIWCANPEGISPKIDIMNDSNRCIGCGACLKSCDKSAVTFERNDYLINRELCNLCGRCTIVCPTNSKKICGEKKTVEQIIKIAKQDNLFYRNSGGGLTLSGGEVLNQPEFTYEILKRCKEENINTAIETSGMGSWNWLEKISEVCDTIFYDIKAIDSEKHKHLTGINNEIILNNLVALDKKIASMVNYKPALIIRMPLIKGYNANDSDIKQVALFIKNNLTSYSGVEILPFHNIGEQKYKKLDLQYEFKDCLNSGFDEYDDLVEIMKDMGIPIKVLKW